MQENIQKQSNVLSRGTLVVKRIFFIFGGVLFIIGIICVGFSLISDFDYHELALLGFYAALFILPLAWAILSVAFILGASDTKSRIRRILFGIIIEIILVFFLIIILPGFIGNN